MKAWTLIAVLLCASVANGLEGNCTENSWCRVTFRFVNEVALPELPVSYQFIISDRNSGKTLYTSPVITAASAPCVVPATGCSSFIVPETGMPFVGKCSNNPNKGCTTNADCGSGTCQVDRQQRLQEHVVTTKWPTGPGTQTKEVVFTVLNNEFAVP